MLVNGAEVSGSKDKQLARMLASDVGVLTGTGPGARVTVREYVEIAGGGTERRLAPAMAQT